MTQEVVIGVGLTVLFAFARWRFPAVPRYIADAGILAGALMVLAGMTLPQLNLTLPVLGLFLAGCLCLGAAAHLAIKEKPRPTVASPPSAATNTMGNVKNEGGIVTQDQQGDNAIRK